MYQLLLTMVSPEVCWCCFTNRVWYYIKWEENIFDLCGLAWKELEESWWAWCHSIISVMEKDETDLHSVIKDISNVSLPSLKSKRRTKKGMCCCSCERSIERNTLYEASFIQTKRWETEFNTRFFFGLVHHWILLVCEFPTKTSDIPGSVLPYLIRFSSMSGI